MSEMASRSKIEEIFSNAIAINSPKSQQDYLNQACGDNAQMRRRVEELLQEAANPDSFFDAPIELEETHEHATGSTAMGTRIGNYKLLQQLGEGGFGVVYMAEQLEPVRRKVALKIIKPGMDTKTVISRFEAERQALAMMDHANIARVFDGGTTEQGRPYFVMELVKGVPITTYCDDNRLRTRDRLELFVEVCKAVQHAHHKGIIHRDIKPNNVMITRHDGKPVVKVIDFGVAKAINQQLTEKTLFTAYGQMIGTPQYMSPEQAEMSGLDVDTRSDIYSLGVLLYELLTGTTPLESERLRSTGYAEMQRMIKEEEPQKPSARLSSSGDKLTHIADHRSVSPEVLHKEIKGDLDWIVMKALEKERGRRYGSAVELASDIHRFWVGDPITARPPTARYRARTFLRKNRALSIGISSVIGALTLGIILALAAWQEALRQSNQKDQALSSLRKVLFDHGLNQAFVRNGIEARQTLQQLRAIPESDELAVLLDAFLAISDERHEDAIEMLTPVVVDDPESTSARGLLTYAYEGVADLDNYWDSHTLLAPLAATSSEELFFKAMPHGIDPQVGVKLVSRAIEQRENPLFYLFRGRMRADWMLQAGRFDLLPDAERDVQKATAWLGYRGNAGAEALRTYVTLLYAAKANSDKDEVAYQRIKAKCKEIAASMDHDDKYGWWNKLFFANFYYEMGEHRRALKVLEQAARDGHEFAIMFYLMLAYELDIAPADDLLSSNQYSSDYSAIGRAAYFAETGNQSATERYVKQVIQAPSSIDAAIAAVTALYSFDKSNQVQRFVKEIQFKWQHKPMTSWDRWQYDHLLPFFLNRDEALLLESARSSSYPNRNLTYAHSYIAATRYVDGDTDGAREHYKECFDNHLLYNGDYWWSRALLTRHPVLSQETEASTDE